MPTILNKWRLKCVTEDELVYWWLEEGLAAPTTCPHNSAHTIAGVAIKVDSTEKAFANRNLPLDDDVQVTTPGMIGGQKVPESPVIYDMLGGEFRAVHLKTTGAARIEWYVSVNSDDPLGESDYSNIEWRLIETQLVSEPKRHDIPHSVLGAARTGRYLKMDPGDYDTVEVIEAYGT